MNNYCPIRVFPYVPKVYTGWMPVINSLLHRNCGELMRRKEQKPVIIPKDWRKKLDIRSKSRQMLAKGLIKKLPCQLCYEPDSKMTHVDYDDPLHVTWLCKKHFLIFQRGKRQN